MRRIGWLAAVGLVLAAGHAGAARGGVADVLLLTHTMGAKGEVAMDETLRARLEKRGIELKLRPLDEPIGAKQLELFHAVVLPDYGGLQMPNFHSGRSLDQHFTMKQNLKRLRGYVRKGGGLLVSPMVWGGGRGKARIINEMLEPWGARVRGAQVWDPEHAGAATEESRGSRATYAWTTRIADHPAAKGVDRIWYPQIMIRWDDIYATLPLVLEDEAWQPLVRGMPSSRAGRALNYDDWFALEGTKAPPFAAVRRAGEGRVGLLTVRADYTFKAGYRKAPRTGEGQLGRVDGIFLEKGNGKKESDGLALLRGMIGWLAKAGRRAGFGGYTEKTFENAGTPEATKHPRWITHPFAEESGARPIRALVGARTAYSSGSGSVADYARAARKAGYELIVFTERFEKLTRKEWNDLVRACRRATGEGFAAMPGIDIADQYQNRYLVAGQKSYPSRRMLGEEGDVAVNTQFFTMGFAPHVTAIHRPSSTPMPRQLYKHWSGISVYTYNTDGKLVDDGRLAYQWQIRACSNPLPLAVHEVTSPDDVSTAAESGHQLFIYADTPENAMWYLRGGRNHLWEMPTNLLVTEGPMIEKLGRPYAVGDARHHRLKGGPIEVSGDAPIERIDLRYRNYPIRRWRPGTKNPRFAFRPPGDGAWYWSYFFIEDAKGRTAVTPGIAFGTSGKERYLWRIGDRQNWLNRPVIYTGTELGRFRIHVPSFSTLEGSGLWPVQKGVRLGENMAPLLEPAYHSKDLVVTDAALDQRYWHANRKDVGYDAKPAHGTTRSRVYRGRVRFEDFVLREPENHKVRHTLKEIELALRMPVTPPAEKEVYPWFAHVGAQPAYGYRDPKTGEMRTGTLEEGFVDLPVGGYAGDIVALSGNLRVNAAGRVGFAAPEAPNGPLPAGTSWRGRFVDVPKKKRARMRRYMGVTRDTPYALKLERGELERIAYVARMKADGHGVQGTIEPAEPEAVPHKRLPVAVTGVNFNWQAGVIQGDRFTRCGVFEGEARARIEITRGGSFYVGNIVAADDPRLRLHLEAWNAERIEIWANNPTKRAIHTRVWTPATLETGKYELEPTKVSIPAGTSKRLSFPE